MGKSNNNDKKEMTSFFSCVPYSSSSFLWKNFLEVSTPQIFLCFLYIYIYIYIFLRVRRRRSNNAFQWGLSLHVIFPKSPRLNFVWTQIRAWSSFRKFKTKNAFKMRFVSSYYISQETATQLRLTSNLGMVLLQKIDFVCHTSRLIWFGSQLLLTDAFILGYCWSKDNMKGNIRSLLWG